MPTQDEALTNVEPTYFLEYALFSGAHREYVVQALEDHYKRGYLVHPTGWKAKLPFASSRGQSGCRHRTFTAERLSSPSNGNSTPRTRTWEYYLIRF